MADLRAPRLYRFGRADMAGSTPTLGRTRKSSKKGLGRRSKQKNTHTHTHIYIDTKKATNSLKKKAGEQVNSQCPFLGSSAVEALADGWHPSVLDCQSAAACSLEALLKLFGVSPGYHGCGKFQ